MVMGFGQVDTDDVAAGLGKRDAKVFARCLESQRAAGFKVPDARKVECECGAAGFNTGWGYWKFGCGRETMPDGTNDVECPRAAL